MEAGDFFWHNSVSDIIAAHVKMLLLFEKYYPEHEEIRGQNMLIVNPFLEHKETTQQAPLNHSYPCTRPVFPNCQPAACYRVLESIISGREKFSRNLSF
jgi:hypothetical protein